MSLRLALLNYWTKLTHWEYWPFAVVYLPIFFYWLWLSMKARSLFFFSAANPSIETGGMLGESKYLILDKISPSLKPKTILIATPADLNGVMSQIREAGITFPFIAKPDSGERGRRVEKIHNLKELTQYLLGTPTDFLIQEYVDYPLELGVFYYRLPGQAQGTISSVVIKEFLYVTGDGTATLRQLIMRNERARLQYQVLFRKYRSQLQNVLPAGEKMTLVWIGNHSRGTRFVNGNHLITASLTGVFERISQSISGFYYGRYDIRCRSLEALYRGEGIMIMELNGAGAEPAHIYDPAFSRREAYRVLFRHWHVLYQISTANHAKGTPYMTTREVLAMLAQIRTQRQKLQPA